MFQWMPFCDSVLGDWPLLPAQCFAHWGVLTVFQNYHIFSGGFTDFTFQHKYPNWSKLGFFQLCFPDAFHFNRNKTWAKNVKLTEHSLLFFRLQCMARRHWVLFEFFQFANTPEYVKLSLWFRCRLLHNMFRVWKNVAENKYSVLKGGT